MRLIGIALSLSMLAAPAALLAQDSSSQQDLPAAATTAPQKHARNHKMKGHRPAPFSRLAIGAGFSPMGIRLMAATNANRYIDIRGVGNFFQYTVNNISSNGFNADAKLDLASAGVSMDFYPFPNHGFRLSPGLLFLNNNSVDATFSVAGGTRFTLNHNSYYSSTSNPVQGVGSIGFNAQKPAFTMTLGYGRLIPASGGHWSFPFELGAAFTGSPTVNMNLTNGQVCDAQGLNCQNVATDTTLQSDLQAQISTYKKDLDPLKVYPIISFGVAFNFHI